MFEGLIAGQQTESDELMELIGCRKWMGGSEALCSITSCWRYINQLTKTIKRDGENKRKRNDKEKGEDTKRRIRGEQRVTEDTWK